MMKTHIACTAEVDDIDVAVDEIKSQLNLDVNMLKNSVGIISCHYEFVESGAAKAVCDALPFDVVGTVAAPLSACGQTSDLLLSIIMITGDDVEFDIITTSSLIGDPCGAITESYKSGVRDERPKLIFLYGPFIPQNSGDDYAHKVTEVSGGVPCFGSLAIDDMANYENCFMLLNDEHYPDKLAMVLVYGNIEPKFYIANISEDRIVDKSAVVTKSRGAVVMEINGRSIDEYFEELGLNKASEMHYGLSMLPFMIDHQDGGPKVCKIFIQRTPERHAVFAGNVPEGSLLYVGSTDRDDVLLTTKKMMEYIIEDAADASGLLIYSCIARSMTMGGEKFAEMNLVNEMCPEHLAMMMSCSGGEFCPTLRVDGIATNRYHNNAFVACLF